VQQAENKMIKAATSKIQTMLQDIEGESVDNDILDEALGQIASKFKLDQGTLNDVKGMASRILSGESIEQVVSEVSDAPSATPSKGGGMGDLFGTFATLMGSSGKKSNGL